MSFEKTFKEVKQALTQTDTKSLHRCFAFQCNITGEGEGAFYISYKDGKLQVEPYDYRDRDAQFWASGDTWVKLTTGQLTYDRAIKDGYLTVTGSYDTARELAFLHGTGGAETAYTNHGYYHDVATGTTLEQ